MFTYDKKNDQRKELDAMRSQLEQNYENKFENYDNASNSLMKGSIVSAIKYGKSSKDDFTRIQARRLEDIVSQMPESELVNQRLFNDLYLSLKNEPRALEMLETASEISSHDKKSMYEALSEPHIKLKEESIDDLYEAKTSVLNGEVYYVNKQDPNEILSRDEFNYTNDMKHNKDVVAMAGFTDGTGPNDRISNTNTKDGVEFSGLAQAKADMAAAKGESND